MMQDLRRRSPAEVFEEHLRLAGVHHFEEDIGRNVAPQIIILECRGIFKGREGAITLARLLEKELPKVLYFYTNRLIEGHVAFLEWTSEGENATCGTAPIRLSSKVAGSWSRSTTPWNWSRAVREIEVCFWRSQ